MDEQADQQLDAAVTALRQMIIACETFRASVAHRYRVGVRETVAITHLSKNGPMTQSQLTAALGLAGPSVTSVIDRLETAGLARREPNPDDRRSTLVVLTDDARRRARTARVLMAECFEDEDLVAVTGVLERVAARLTAAGEQTDRLEGPVMSRGTPAASAG